MPSPEVPNLISEVAAKCFPFVNKGSHLLPPHAKASICSFPGFSFGRQWEMQQTPGPLFPVNALLIEMRLYHQQSLFPTQPGLPPSRISWQRPGLPTGSKVI